MHALLAPLLSLSLGWVSPEIHLSPTTREPAYVLRYFPAAGFNGTEYLVAWEDERVGGGIFLSRVAPDGTVLDPLGIKVGEGSHPSVASNGSEFFVVWDGTVGNTRSILGQRVDGTGAFVGAQITIASNSDYISPAASFDGTNYVVAWANSFSTGIFAARVSPTGSVVDATPITVDNSASVGSFDERPVAVASIVGTTLIAYESTINKCTVSGKRLLSNGTLVDSTALPLSAQSGFSSYCQPTVASDGSGFAVTYPLYLSSTSQVDMVRVPATGAASPVDVVGSGYNDGINWSVTPAIVSAGGNWLIVWNEALRDGLRAMRMNSSGAKVDASPKVISSGGTDDVAAVAGSNGVFAVYERLSKSSSIEYLVEGARLDNAATLLGTSAISQTARKQVSTSYAAGNNGQGFVAWVDGPGIEGTKRIVGTRVGRDGQPLDVPPIQVGGLNLPWEVSAAFDGTDYVVAWSDYVSIDGGIDVYATKVHPDGGLASGAIPLATLSANERYPQVAGGQGEALVCWDRGTSFACSALHADAGITANVVVKSTNAMYGSRFAMGYDGTDWLVAWSDETASINPKIYAQRLSSSFAPIGGPRQVGPYSGVTVNSMAVAGGPEGYLVAYIKDALYSSPRLYATRLSLDGGQLDTSVPPMASGGALESFGGITASWNGDWIVGWQETRTGTGSDVLIRRLTDAGTWVDAQPVVISASADEEVSPSVGALGPAIAVAYVRADSTPTEAEPRARLRVFSTLAAPGTSCTDGTQCGSGACVTGVCCESFCNYACTGGVCQVPVIPDAGDDAGQPGTDGGAGNDGGSTQTDGGGNPTSVAITSTPPVSGGCNQTFDYQPVVDGAGPLLFSLSKAPEGMTVDPNTGHVTWTPRSDQVGTFDAELVVSSSSGFTRQSFSVEGACTRIGDDIGPNAGGCHCGAVDGSFVLMALASLTMFRRRAR